MNSSTSWSWKHRFYTFLLRRALGSFLTSRSAAELHRSIQDIDWSEGKLVLVDVELDPTYLTSLIHGGDNQVGDPSGEDETPSTIKTQHNIAVQRAFIRRFAIHLSLCDIEHQSAAKSPTRKATSMLLHSLFGSDDSTDDYGESSTSGIALVAQVEIEGLEIILAPNNGRTTAKLRNIKQSPKTTASTTDQDAAAPGFISSLVDSALKSLRLSISVVDARVRAYSQYCDNFSGLNDTVNVANDVGHTALDACWISVHLTSAKYYDLIDREQKKDNASQAKIHNSTEKMVISKALDWESIAIETGQTNSPFTRIFFQSSGDGRLRFRVFEKWAIGTDRASKPQFISARQDVEVSLDHQIAVELDLCSMVRVVEITNSVTARETTLDSTDSADFEDPVNEDLDAIQAYSTLADDFTREAYDQIMKRYTEARHLARTKELRGGLLIPSFDEGGDVSDDRDISFDAFFDANDHSVSYYCSIVDENSSSEIELLSGMRVEGRRRILSNAKFELGLAEFTVKIQLNDDPMEATVTGSQQDQSEFVLLSMGDLRVVLFGSEDGESKINCSISHFDIEGQLVESDSTSQRSQTTIINESLLRFVDDSAGGNEMLVSSPPCMSVLVEKSVIDKETLENGYSVDMILQPLEIIHRDRAMSCLSNMATKLLILKSSVKEESQPSKQSSTRVSVSCVSVIVLVPYCNDTIHSRLFERCGYKDQTSRSSPFLGLGLELDNISFDFSNRHMSASCPNVHEAKSVVKVSNVILFSKVTGIERSGRRGRRKLTSYVSRRTDLLVCTGSDESESDACVVVSLSQITPKHNHPIKRNTSAFPMILPLSSLKAHQESDDSDGIEEFYSDALKSTNNQPQHDACHVRSSDPQFVMSSEANETQHEVVVRVPNIFFDITKWERDEFHTILSSLGSGGDRDKPNVEPPKPENAVDKLGLAINVGQASILLHGHDNIDSYSIIMDKIQLHTLMTPSGVRNLRVLSHDVTLYELSNLSHLGSIQLDNEFQFSSLGRSKRVQERFTEHLPSFARVIFFRSKLCQPLSPETPAVMIDVLFRGGVDGLNVVAGDDVYREKSIHANIYDMTYRYNMNSEWIQNITSLLKSETSQQAEEKETHGTDDSEEHSLTNLFVNLTDCNFDYTSPLYYKTASRVILRLGEVRLSSNVVSSSAMQAYKTSLSDVYLHLCNHRHLYNEENEHISCSHRHFNSNDLVVPDGRGCLSGRTTLTFNDVLSRMGFVHVAMLDTLDAIILRASSANRRCNDPATTIALTLGKLSLNVCRDSLSCLSSTVDDWLVKFTAVSEEELNAMRELSERQSMIGAEKKSNTNEVFLPFEQQRHTTEDDAMSLEPSEKLAKSNTKKDVSPLETDIHQSYQSIFRDDDVYLDLTKSLLLQNYYTFDATKTRPTINHPNAFAERSQEPIISLQSSSSDDEWAAVEHDYIRNSKLPPDQEQHSEWIICDANNGEQTQQEARTDFYSQQVKIFPQHIPSRPIFDPLAVGSSDAAKLAGTHTPPAIGLCFIVKDASIKCHFFDGLDFVHEATSVHRKQQGLHDRRKMLLNDLVDGNEQSATLNGILLPEERNERLRREFAQRKLRRNTQRYFSISIDGLKLKQDSFVDSAEHRLASCLDLSMSDLFIAETISNKEPVKLLGEWSNESQHPRDDNDGIVTLKMVTKHPSLRVSADGKLMSDESRATLELLPLRCYFNQSALRFIRGYFADESSNPNDDNNHTDDKEVGGESEDGIIPVFFTSFKVWPSKLKVDYTPDNMDVHALRDGSYAEILNLCPLEDMVLTLQPVENHDLLGWGSVFSELSSRWIEDICATQLSKFVTRATPLQLISTLTEGVADLAMVVIVPAGSFTDYFKNVVVGTTSFAGKVALETLSTSAKLTKFAASQLNVRALASIGGAPSRPRSVPRHIGDSAGYSYESITRGLRLANDKVVVMPLKEYRQTGTSGAAKSIVKGLPVAVLAPLSGASEALSYTLLGLRNQFQPDLRKEEEASLRGLHFDK